MEDSISKILIVKGNIVTREHYLRNDLWCRSKQCQQCHHDNNDNSDEQPQQPPLLDKVDSAMMTGSELDYNANVHYVIPSISVALRYIDLLADTADSVRNIILCETHCKYMQGFRKLYSRMKKMIHPARDPSDVADRRDIESQSCVLFCNEHHRETFVERRASESFEERDRRAIVTMAEWYRTHLDYRVPVVLLVMRDEEASYSSQIGEGVIVETVDRYVRARFSNDSKVLDQLDALTASLKLPLLPDEVEFGDHLPQNVLDKGIAAGNFLRGVLQVNRFNTQEATVKTKMQRQFETDQEEGDLQLRNVIVVDGIEHRNRAIHGDIVAVQLLPEVDWVSTSTRFRKRTDRTASINEESEDKEAKLVPTARVVGILHRISRDFVATIQQDKSDGTGDTPAKTKSEHVLCIPLDRRIPKIRIKTRQRSQLENSRLVVRISGWEKTSMYPDGYYVESIGNLGDLETETKALLLENQLVDNAHKFSKLAMAELPPHTAENPFKIPKEEYLTRKDIRFSHLVMSVDPIGCEDIDDALSVRELKNGNLEFGVHIADVTYFVKHDSQLDLESRKRATTVYLVDRRLDMLPTLLSADLCSLHMGQDRLAFSVFWEMTRRGEVVKAEFVRTIVRSKYALHYDQAQNIIEGKVAAPVESIGKWSECVIAKEDVDSVKKNLTLLQDFAMIIRRKRMKDGALELESLEEVNIKLDRSDDKMAKPTRIITKHHLKIHDTIEEWMIFANLGAARRIYNIFPTSSILRRHPFPKQEGFEQLRMAAAVRGFTINTENNFALAQSLDAANDPRDKFVNLLLRSLATRAMQEAQYFCTGQFQPSEFYHYGLALDFYTHFTSPIRRYSDILVHRMLLRALEIERQAAVATTTRHINENIIDSETLSELCDHINEKNRASAKAQMDSMEWFRAIYFRENECVEDAIIYSIRKDQIFVFVPKFSVKGQIRMTTKEGDIVLAEDDAKELENVEYDADLSFDPDKLEMTATIVRQQGHQRRKHSYKYNLFDHVTVRLTIKESRAHLPRVKIMLKSFRRNQHADALGPAVTRRDMQHHAPETPSARQLYTEQFESIKRQQEKEDEERLYGSDANRISEYEQKEDTLYGMLKRLKSRDHQRGGAKAPVALPPSLSFGKKKFEDKDFEVDIPPEVPVDEMTRRIAQEVKLLESKRALERHLRKIARIKLRHQESQWTEHQRVRVQQEQVYRSRLQEIESRLQSLRLSNDP